MRLDVYKRQGQVYVLDALKNNLTVFRPTPYGQLILQASAYDNNGDYDEAVTYWNQVLQQNTNCEMAYAGIGEAMLKNGEYRQAVDLSLIHISVDNQPGALQTKTVAGKQCKLLNLGSGTFRVSCN